MTREQEIRELKARIAELTTQLDLAEMCEVSQFDPDVLTFATERQETADRLAALEAEPKGDSDE